MIDNRHDKAFLIDMDGVINKGDMLIPGTAEFADRLKAGGYPFLFLTNNSYYTPAEQKQRLENIGIDVGEEHFYTSAMVTASFIGYQNPRGSAYVIGGKGLFRELEKRGIRITRKNPDYVIVGVTD